MDAVALVSVIVSGSVGLAGVGAAAWSTARARDRELRAEQQRRLTDRREHAYDQVLRVAVRLSAAYRRTSVGNGFARISPPLDTLPAEVPGLFLYGSDRMQAAYDHWVLALGAYRTANETKADPLVVSVALEGIGKALDEMTRQAAHELGAPSGNGAAPSVATRPTRT
jgi:hypothetical protein